MSSIVLLYPVIFNDDYLYKATSNFQRINDLVVFRALFVLDILKMLGFGNTIIIHT